MNKQELLLAIKNDYGSMARLAWDINLHRSTISKYFTGERKPTVIAIKAMSKALDLPFDEVMEAFYG